MKTKVQNLTSVHSELRGLGTKVVQHFKHLLYTKKNDLTRFQQTFLGGLEHWRGNHSSPHCNHSMEEHHQKKMSSSTTEALQVVVKEFADKGEKYILPAPAGISVGAEFFRGSIKL